MSAGYVSYIARELATSRIRRLRAMGRVGAGAACVNHLGAVLIFAETSWNTWTLETCWIHVGYMLDFVRARTHIEPMTPTPYFSVSPLLARIIHPKWAHTGLNRSHLGLVGLVGLVGQRLPEDQEVALEDPGGDGFNMHHLWFHWNKKYRKQRHEKKHISQEIRPRF